MEKKIVYYLAAGVALILVVWLIIAMSSKPGEAPEDVAPVEKAPQSEGAVNREIAEKLNLAEGQLPLRVTMDDNGQSASLTPGKNITLMLGADYDWAVSTSNEMVLAPRSVDAGDARVQGVYQVVGEGGAVLSAQGTCKPGADCAQPTASFVFNVDGVISENFSIEELTQ